MPSFQYFHLNQNIKTRLKIKVPSSKFSLFNDTTSCELSHLNPSNIEGDHWTSAETASGHQLDYKNFRQPTAEKRYWKAVGNYVDALTTNIKDCLGNSPKVIEAYAIVDPLLLPSSDKDSFKEYGNIEVKIITNHFFPRDEDNMTKLLRQWSQVKFFLSGRKLQIPAGNQSSTFFMSFMLKDKGIFHHSMSEELLFVAEVGLSLPCSNAWPERGGGVINNTNTKFRNHPGRKINFFFQ